MSSHNRVAYPKQIFTGFINIVCPLIYYRIAKHYVLVDSKPTIIIIKRLSRSDKCVVVDETRSINYDYLFLFNGQQFTYNVKTDEPKKSHKLIDTHP